MFVLKFLFFNRPYSRKMKEGSKMIGQGVGRYEIISPLILLLSINLIKKVDFVLFAYTHVDKSVGINYV